ncbi:hypothetical protein K443DRAFT_674859 [Laccaria amethystina LaAM-08-1]|uniref:Uncharacterized protein n=1 Tax=Laccaria amethystina LaAM-08-1 TaxID=1095629 RepID=A0A0C9XW38_9AGAR|nr:hypothetical protein K443DRAFT_674859 [Laccaria amethystina LaAM-08-1]
MYHNSDLSLFYPDANVAGGPHANRHLSFCNSSNKQKRSFRMTISCVAIFEDI